MATSQLPKWNRTKYPNSPYDDPKYAEAIMKMRYKDMAAFNHPDNVAKRKLAQQTLARHGIHMTVPSNVIGGKPGEGSYYKNGKKYTFSTPKKKTTTKHTSGDAPIKTIPKPPPPPPEEYKTVSGNAARGVVHNKMHTFQTPNGDTISMGADGKAQWKISSKKYKDAKNIVLEAKQFGTDYVKSKYGEEAFNKVASQLTGVGSFIKSTLTGFGRNGMRNAGQEMMNKAPMATDNYKGPGTRSMFRTAGQMATEVMGGLKRQMNFNLENSEDKKQGQHHNWAQATSISHLINSQLSQGAGDPKDYWDTWAGQQTGQTDVMSRGEMGVDIGYTSDGGYGTSGGSNQGPMEEMEDMGEATMFAQSNPMGAFGTNKVMYDLGEEPMTHEQDFGEQDVEYGQKYTKDGYEYYKFDMPTNYSYALGTKQGTAYIPKEYQGERYTQSVGKMTTSEIYWLMYNEPAFEKAVIKAGGLSSSKAKKINWVLPKGIVSVDTGKPSNEMYGGIRPFLDPALNRDPNAPAPADPGPQAPIGPDPLPFSGPNTPKEYTSGFKSTSAVYNPWGYLEGSENNMYGPSRDHMARATMDAMQLANAYFAPQRMELAYELGDMETDMRRLSTSLGRQVDDPVLQAKLYKDASKAVRTLDIQQNTLAFQMVDARRKEELSNFQFYDQLAQEEHRLRLANEHFYKGMDLEGLKYNLSNWQAQYVANNPVQAGGGTPPPTGGSGTGGGTTTGQQDTASGVQSNVTNKNSIYARRYY